MGGARGPRDEFQRIHPSYRQLRKGAPLSLRPLPEPRATVLVVGGSITAADVPGLCERAHAVLDASDVEAVVCDVAAVVDPDLSTIEALTRMQLTARRLGGQVRLHDAPSALQELLAFAGLADVVPLTPGLPVGRPSGQTEEREQRLRVEERVEADDPTA
jgi:ABC-type transporter Mla MlaB component